MTVKVHRDQARIVETQRGHRPPDNDHDSDDGHRSPEEMQRRYNRAKAAESARPPQIADDPRCKKSHEAEREGGPVLRGGEQRQRVEDVRRRSENVVEKRSIDARGGRRVRVHDIYQGRQ